MGAGGKASAPAPDGAPMAGADGVLRIYPPELALDNAADVRVSRLVTVKNVSANTQTVRVKAPTLPNFSLRGLPSLTTRLAPGMEFAFEVSFVASDEEDYFDAVQVCTAELGFDVPLRAFGPKGRLSLAGDLDFGVVIHESVVEKRVTLTNTGKQKATWSAEFDGVIPIVLRPPKGGVPPGESRTVTVAFTAAELGNYSGRVDFFLGQHGQSKLPTPLGFGATVVAQTFAMIDEAGNPCTRLDVGPCFYGSNLTRTLRVVNNGPAVVKYYVRVGPKADIDATLVDDEEIQDAAVASVSIVSKLKRWKENAKDQTFLLSPLDGVLQPYESRKVTVKFRPRNAGEHGQGFKSQHSDQDGSVGHFAFAAVVGFLGIKKNVKLDMTGRGVLPAVSCEPGALRFGDVAVGERVDIPVTLTNECQEVACVARLNLPAYFHAEPGEVLIPPGQSASVLCWYKPKAMGNHEGEIGVDVSPENEAAVVAKRGVLCQGRAHGVPQRAEGTRGPAALPEDFAPARSFAPEGAWAPTGQGTAAEGRARRTARDSTALARTAALRSEMAPGAHAMTDRDLATKKAHDDGYAQFMRASAKARRAAAERAKPAPTTKRRPAPLPADVLDPGVDLGIDAYAGLAPPMPKLPAPNDPLYIDEEFTKGSFVKPRNRPLLLEEERVLLANAADRDVFPAPGDEAKACALRLKTSDITKIAVGPRVIDFGKVATLSSTTRCLAVTNDYAMPIKVSVDSHLIEDLRESKPSVVVVAPGETKGLAIVFTAKTPGKQSLKLGYVINDYHFHSVSILVEVVPVTLNVSSEMIPFRFGAENYGYEVKEVLTLSNPNSMKAEFSLELVAPEALGGSNPALVEKYRASNSRFSVRPASGVVGPKDIQEVTITWRINASKNGAIADESVLMCKVVGGEEKRVKLTASLPDARVVTKQKEVDFGVFATCTSSTHTIVLRNRGAQDASVVLDETIFLALGDKLTVSKKKARIGAGQSCEFELTLFLMEQEEIDEKISFYVRGGKPVRVTIKASAVTPVLTIDTPMADMGDVNIGGSCRRPLLFRNPGPVETVFHVDMKAAGQFRLELPRDGGDWTLDDYHTYPPLSKVRTEGGGVSPSQGSTMTIDDPSLEDRPIPEGHTYKLVVLPENNLKLNLVYRPREVGQKELGLLCEVLGAHAELYETITVRCNGLRPRLILSDSILDFGQRIILMDRQRKMPYSQEMTIKNNDRVPLQWHFGSPMVSVDGSAPIPSDFKSEDDPLAKPPRGAHTLSVEPSSGELAVGETAKVRFNFLPREALGHEATVPLYLGGEARSYLDLEVRGFGRLPRLLFDTVEVVLPVVPLGVRSVQRFYVLNDGYTNLELQSKMPVDAARLPIELHFPEGKMIGLAKNRLPVDVRFTSAKPMSFTTEIEFVDDDGNRYPLAITGTADNSLLTSYSFAKANAAVMDMGADGEAAPVRLRIPEPVPEEPGHKSPSTEPFVMLNPFNPRACMRLDSLLRPKVVSSALSRYFAATTGRKIDELSHDCSASRGRIMIEVLQRLSGKALGAAGARNEKLSTGPAAAIGGVHAMAAPGGTVARKYEQTENLLRQYDAMLSFLKSHGCLLNIVKPEHLLDADDLKRAVEYRESVLEPATSHGNRGVVSADEHGLVQTPPGAIMEAWRTLENQRDHINAVAWHFVYCQVLRVFVASKVNVKTIKSFPGIGDPSLVIAAAGLAADKGGGDAPGPNAGLARSLSTKSEGGEGGGDQSPLALASNLYSTSELLLLGWCTAHFKAAMPGSAKRVTNFAYDFKDGLVLYALLLRHWPAFEQYMGAIKKDSPKDDERWANCTAVCKMCEELGLQYKVTPEELYDPDDRDMLVFVLYLSQMLPMYVPCATLELNANVSRTQQRHVELANPSSRPIHYVAKIVGHEDYSIPTPFVNVEPKSTCHFEVVCKPTTTKATMARLILTPTGIEEGGALASVLCFELRNESVEDDPLDTSHITTRVYEIRTRELIVQNPFPVDVELAVSYHPCEVPKPPEPELTEAEQKEIARQAKKAEMERARKGKAPKVDVPLEELLNPNRAIGNPPIKMPHTGPSAPLPFAVDRKVLRLKANESGKLMVTFLPWVEGEQAFRIRLEEKEFGAFCVMVIGMAIPPAPIVSQKLTFELDEEGETLQDIPIVLPFPNSYLETARRMFLEKHPLSKNKEMADMCRSASAETPQELMYLVKRENPNLLGPKLLTLRSKEALAGMAGMAALKGQSAAAGAAAPGGGAGEAGGDGGGGGEAEAGSAAASAAAGESGDGADPAGEGDAASTGGGDDAAAPAENEDGAQAANSARGSLPPAQVPNTLMLRFAPRKAGVYPCRVFLQGLFDVRVIEIEITVPAPQLEATLDFEGPSRSRMEQLIPLVNAGDRPLIVRAQFAGSDAFTGPREVQVPGTSSGEYPLSFYGKVAGEFRGELQLNVVSSSDKVNPNDQSKYVLRGISQAPLAEHRLEFVCQARTQSSITVEVPNIIGAREVRYAVFTDLPFVSGDAECVVASPRAPTPGQKSEGGDRANPPAHPHHKTTTYELRALPPRSGTYTGCLTFLDTVTGQYCWFVVDVRVTRPPPEDAVALRCAVRDAVVASVSVTNPLDYDVTFDVSTVDCPGVLVEPRFVLPAKSSADFEIAYCPLIEGSSSGFLLFASDLEGEFYYTIEAVADAAPVIALDPIECEVGARTEVSATVTNPTDEEVVLTVSSDNPRNFVPNPASGLVLPPFGTGEFRIEYAPSSTGTQETGLVTLAHRTAGTWEFALKGSGTLPTVMDETNVSSAVSQAATAHLMFRNPFAHPLACDITLQADDDATPFKLVLPSRKSARGYVVGPFSQLTIPLVYSPADMRESRAMVVVEGSPKDEASGADPVRWTYPVVGVAEAPGVGAVLRFAGKARQRTDETFEVTLSGLSPENHGESFTSKVIVDSHHVAALSKALVVTPMSDKIDVNGPLRFRLSFMPLKPLQASVAFVVTKASGGRWRFELQLDVSGPEPDGKVFVGAAVGGVGHTALLVRPEGGAPSSFHARIVDAGNIASTEGLEVSPTSGTMPADGPLELKLSYAPREYGRDAHGLLEVTSEERQWVYTLRGSVPKYKPPKGEKKVSSNLDEQTAKELAKAEARATQSLNLVKKNLHPDVKRVEHPTFGTGGASSQIAFYNLGTGADQHPKFG